MYECIMYVLCERSLCTFSLIVFYKIQLLINFGLSTVNYDEK